MNFTREPIIETIVSPKDGYKLCIRNSKVSGSEELFVDAVEVVSFGSSLFFRGTERPKPFLVPVSDYEIFEVKETRVVLKNISHDRNIKIGGGREAPVKAVKEQVVVEPKEEAVEEDSKELAGAEASQGGAPDSKNDRKRDRRRSRRRRLAEEKKDWVDKPLEEGQVASEEKAVQAPVEEVKSSSSMFSHLLPPPPVLISERLSRMREKELLEGAVALSASPVTEVREESVSKVLPEENERLEPGSSTFLDKNEEDFPI